jgi:hypothetical protein
MIVRMPARARRPRPRSPRLRGGSAIPTTPDQAQLLLLDAGAHRDAQHAQTARRHVGVRLAAPAVPDAHKGNSSSGAPLT